MQRPATISLPSQFEIPTIFSPQSFSSEFRQKHLYYQCKQCRHQEFCCSIQKNSQYPKMVQRKKKGSCKKGNRDHLNPAMLKVTRRIKELTKRKQLKQIFEEVSEANHRLGKLSKMAMNALLSACVHCHDMDSAFQVFNDMSKPGACGVNHITYDILLKGLGEAQRLDEAFELLESIERSTILQNPQSLEWLVHTLVNGFVQRGEVRRAKGVLLHFRAQQRKGILSVLSYNLLIKGYARSENPLECLTLKKEMDKQGVRPDRVTYNTLILACVKARRMDFAMDIFTEMKEKAKEMNLSGLFPDVITYTTLLKGFANDGNINGVSSIAGEMRIQKSSVLDRVAYSAIIDAFLAVGLTSDAIKVFEELCQKAKSDAGFRPKAHVFLSLMRSFAKEGNVLMVQGLHARMVPECAGNPSPCLRAEADWLLLEAAVHGGQASFAKQFLDSIKKKNRKLILNDRAFMTIVQLQCLSGFADNYFQPRILQKHFADEPVEKIMIPYIEARPMPAKLLLSKIVMRFYKDDVIPVEDGWGNFIGFVHREDCKDLDVELSAIIRSPPPYVTSHLSVQRALSFLLDKKRKMVAVVKPMPGSHDMPGYLPGQAVGFLNIQHLLNTCTDSNLEIR